MLRAGVPGSLATTDSTIISDDVFSSTIVCLVIPPNGGRPIARAS
eukprot:COSAG01_NODE_53378_length_339_cov_1.641667_1_plen_44_part_01